MLSISDCEISTNDTKEFVLLNHLCYWVKYPHRLKNKLRNRSIHEDFDYVFGL